MIRVLRQDIAWVGLAVIGALIVGVGLFVDPMLLLAAAPLPLVVGALIVRPTLSIPFLFVAIMVSDGFGGVGFVVPITISKLSMVIVIGSWFTHCLFTERWPVKPHTVWLPMVATTAVLLVGMIYARTIGVNGRDLVVGYISLCILMVVVDALADPRHLWGALRILAWSFVVVVALSSVYGSEIYEGLTPRSLGFGGNPNEWAAMVLLGTGPAVAILENEGTLLGRIGAVAALLVSAIAVFLTVSRAGIVVYGAMLPFIVAILWSRRAALLLGLGALVVGVLIFVDLSAVYSRFDSFLDSSELELDGSVRDRGLAQRFAIESFLRSPFIGIGTGGFLAEVEVQSGGQVVKETHNTYLQLLSENGLVGAAVFVWPLVYFGRALWHSWRRQTTPRFRRLVLGMAASFTSFLLMLYTMNGLTLTTGFFFMALILVVERVSRLPTEQLEDVGLA